MNSTRSGWTSRVHMKKRQFERLYQLLRHKLNPNELQSRRSTSGNDPIYGQVVLATGLRYLGGSLAKDTADLYGFSHPYAPQLINKFLDAVDKCPELQIKLPQTTEELKRHADDWDEHSGADGLYYGVVGAIDGWLACTDAPSLVNVTDYFSGHYQRYGLNVQAVCDANLRFIFMTTNSPGKTNDARAYSRCINFRNWVDNLPEGYFVIGDNAYTLTNKMLIPFSGADRRGPISRTYNFYLCQLRIRIEMAFGRLTTKWRIFRKNLNCTCEKNAKIIRVGMMLHNFVIDTDYIDTDYITFRPSTGAPLDLESFENIPLDDGPGDLLGYNFGYFPVLQRRNHQHTTETITNIPRLNQQHTTETITRRPTIVDEIRNMGLQRPNYNIVRNSNRDGNEDIVYELDPEEIETGDSNV